MDGVNNVNDVQTQSQIYAFKQAEEAQRTQVLTLLEALPNPQQPAPQYNNPPNLGQSVDVMV